MATAILRLCLCLVMSVSVPLQPYTCVKIVLRSRNTVPPASDDEFSLLCFSNLFYDPCCVT